MASINVSADELERLSSAYATTAHSLEQQLAHLRAQSGSLRQDWVGSSSMAFQQRITQLEAAERQLVDALHGIAKALAAASAAYRSVDSNISSAFDV